MKKILFSIVTLLLTLVLQAQSDVIEEMFNKYSEKQGFSVVVISSKMFSMFTDMNTENNDAENLISRLKSIRILAVEDSLLNKNINFYNEIGRKLDQSLYEELMVVKEGSDITKFLIRQTGKFITELLVITGGPGGNSLISIKGDFNLKNISELSKSVGIDELKGLERVDRKIP